MTARRRPARRRRGGLVMPRPLLAVLLAVAALMLGADVLAHLWALAVLAAACGGYWLGRRQAPGPSADRARVDAALEHARRELEARGRELEARGRELAEARESAALAWDAAAEQPPPLPCPSCGSLLAYSHGPDCTAHPDARGRRELLADPRSGARPLIGGDDQ